MEKILYKLIALISIIALLYKLIRNWYLSFRWQEYLDAKGRALEEDLQFLLDRKIKGITLRNVYLPSYNGNFVEIDVLNISSRGVIVGECKNYVGTIYGGVEDREWIKRINKSWFTYDKYPFYSPVLQNKGHIKWLQKEIGKEIPVYSLIVFADTAVLRCSDKESKEEGVPWIGNLRRVKRYIRKFFKKKPVCLSASQVEILADKLTAYTNASNSLKKKHVKQINNSR